MPIPSTQYAQTSDGVHIAYWVTGSGPPLIVLPYKPNISWLAEQKIEEARQYFERLAQSYTVIALDARGTGMSDDDVADLSLAALVRDVEAVADAEQLKQFSLFGATVCGPVAVSFAAAHPERVSHLVLWATGASWRAYIGTRGLAPRAVVALHDAKTFADTISMLVIGRSLASEVPRYAQLVQETTTPDRWLAVMEARHGDDVTEQLSAVRVPTLVMTREESMASVSAGRELAAAIDGARLVLLSGESIVPYFGDAGAVIETLRDFLGSKVDAEASAVAGAFRTLLFTDLESSTALTQSLGDAKAQEVLHGHNDAVRAALAAHQGEEVKHTGDGIFAAFGSAASAVEAALQIQRDLAGGEVRVRIGLNAGEPIAEDDDYFGAAVQLAARVCDRAEPGQILVPQVVRDLCAGKTFTFADQGEATLKGFPEPVRLFVVRSTLRDDGGEAE